MEEARHSMTDTALTELSSKGHAHYPVQVHQRQVNQYTYLLAPMGSQLERFRIFLHGLACLQLIESARVVVISRSSWPLERFCKNYNDSNMEGCRINHAQPTTVTDHP